MRVLITGASGYLAGELIKRLRADNQYQVVAVSQDPERIEKRVRNSGISCIANNALLRGAVDAWQIDVLMHTAFARKEDGQQLCASLDFSEDVFEWAASRGAAIINISSQSVYGAGNAEPPDEKSQVCPGDLYGMAKFASERLLESIAGGKKSGICYANIRMASVIGPGMLLPSQPKRVVVSMLERALSGKDIQVTGGRQKFSYIDERDAVDALMLLLEKGINLPESAYNLGPLAQTGIMEIAETARDLTACETGRAVRIILEESETELNWGMNSELLYGALGWRPRHRFCDSAEAILRRIINGMGV